MGRRGVLQYTVAGDFPAAAAAAAAFCGEGLASWRRVVMFRGRGGEREGRGRERERESEGVPMDCTGCLSSAVDRTRGFAAGLVEFAVRVCPVTDEALRVRSSRKMLCYATYSMLQYATLTMLCYARVQTHPILSSPSPSYSCPASGRPVAQRSLAGAYLL